MIRQAASQISAGENSSLQIDQTLKNDSQSTAVRQAAQSNPALKLKALSLFVMIGGAVVVVSAAIRQFSVPDHTWLAMVALALFVAPMGRIVIPGVKAMVTLGDTITFTCAAIFGPDAAVIAALTDGAVTSLKVTSSPRKILYNTAMCPFDRGSRARHPIALPLVRRISERADCRDGCGARLFHPLLLFSLDSSGRGLLFDVE